MKKEDYVLVLHNEGYTNREIGYLLDLQYSTVKKILWDNHEEYPHEDLNDLAEMIESVRFKPNIPMTKTTPEYLLIEKQNYTSYKEMAAFMLETLTAREAKVLTERCAKGRTLEDVSHDFEVTRERIRQIQKKAIAKLLRRFRSLSDLEERVMAIAKKDRLKKAREIKQRYEWNLAKKKRDREYERLHKRLQDHEKRRNYEIRFRSDISKCLAGIKSGGKKRLQESLNTLKYYWMDRDPKLTLTKKEKIEKAMAFRLHTEIMKLRSAILRIEEHNIKIEKRNQACLELTQAGKDRVWIDKNGIATFPKWMSLSRIEVFSHRPGSLALCLGSGSHKIDESGKLDLSYEVFHCSIQTHSLFRLEYKDGYLYMFRDAQAYESIFRD